MKTKILSAALCALATAGGASAGTPLDLQPALYAQLDFGQARSAPALHFGAQLSWSDRVVDGLAQRLDPDAYRTPDTLLAARRSLREAVPPVLQLDFTGDSSFQSRLFGAPLAAYLPYGLAADGAQTGVWQMGKPLWITLAVVAGVGATAALAGGEDEDDNDSVFGPDSPEGSSNDQGCNIVGGSNGDVQVVEGCEDQIPGGG